MARTIEAEYIAKENILKLAQPLSGVADHARVSIEVKEAPAASGQHPDTISTERTAAHNGGNAWESNPPRTR